MKLSYIPVIIALLSSCQNARPSFANMSEVELAAYNDTQPMGNKVYCVHEAGTSTFIRKRTCRTVNEWVQYNERQAMALEVLSVPSSYNLPGTILQDGPQQQ